MEQKTLFNSEVPQFKESHLVVIRHDGLRMIGIKHAALAITCETGVYVSYSDISRAWNDYPLMLQPVDRIGKQNFFRESDMYQIGQVIAEKKRNKASKRKGGK
jgi:hypothetical protein